LEKGKRKEGGERNGALHTTKSLSGRVLVLMVFVFLSSSSREEGVGTQACSTNPQERDKKWRNQFIASGRKRESCSTKRWGNVWKKVGTTSVTEGLLERREKWEEKSNPLDNYLVDKGGKKRWDNSMRKEETR